VSVPKFYLSAVIAFAIPAVRGDDLKPNPSAYLMNLASGTSMNPESWPMPMLMERMGGWRLMLMGQAFVVETQQTGPRGAGKLYSPNMFMISAEHSLGRGTVMLEGMFSLEPATITNRSYPELFQTGETAYGRPLVDAQHPHDFVMGLSVHYARAVGESALFEIMYAPVGDPALGPVAYPHRASSAEIPQATLGHHWQDSTHIATNVVTVAVKYRKVRLETSGFNGTEPGENRWIFYYGPINSWSVRASWFFSRNWMAQASAGRLVQPERQQPGDVVRSTASLHYTRPLGHGNSWSSSLVWGRNHDILTQRNLNSYLVETVYPFKLKNFVTGRAELVDKDELFENSRAYRIGEYIAGYTRDIATYGKIQTGVGFNLTAYSLPPAIKPLYGDHPFGASVFLRLRLVQGESAHEHLH
jgi:hypothetical protein